MPDADFTKTEHSWSLTAVAAVPVKTASTDTYKIAVDSLRVRTMQQD